MTIKRAVEWRSLELKLADDGEKLGVIAGYGSTFGGEPDSYGDVVAKGAFKSSLAEWKKKGRLPPMLLQHGGGLLGTAEDLLPVGKWTLMKEDNHGLYVEGELFATDTERGRYIVENLKAENLALSIGFRVRKFSNGTRAGEPDRTLEEVDLQELSLVTFPANENAQITSVKAFTLGQVREFESRLRDAGFSRKQCKTAVQALMQVPLQEEEDAGNAHENEAAGIAEALNELDAYTASIVRGIL